MTTESKPDLAVGAKDVELVLNPSVEPKQYQA